MRGVPVSIEDTDSVPEVEICTAFPLTVTPDKDLSTTDYVLF